MTDKIKFRNTIAMLCIGLAKVAGMGGVACGYVGKITLGEGLLLTSGAFIVTAVTLSIINSRELEKEDNKDVDLLRKMMEQGTLKEHLKQIGYR